jgi:hypothetical protein
MTTKIGLRTGQPRNRRSIPAVSREFSRLRCAQTGSGVHPGSYSMDNGGPVRWVKRPSEAGHSSPYSTEVKNDAVIVLLPHMSSWCAKRKVCLSLAYNTAGRDDIYDNVA